MPRHENPHFACPAPACLPPILSPLGSLMAGLSPPASLMAGLLLLGLLLLGGCAGAERASDHGGGHRADHAPDQGASEAPKHAPKHALKHAPEPGGDAATWFFDFGASDGWDQDRDGGCAPPLDAGTPAACGADAHSGHDPGHDPGFGSGHDPGLGPVPEIIRDGEMRRLPGLLPDGGM